GRARNLLPGPIVDPTSTNAPLMSTVDETLANFWRVVERASTELGKEADATSEQLRQVAPKLREAHRAQDVTYLALQHVKQEAMKVFEARSSAERDVQSLVRLQQQRAGFCTDLARLHEDRKALKAAYILTRDQISELRESVAAKLQSEAGTKVRIRV